MDLCGDEAPLVDGIENAVTCILEAGHLGSHSANSEKGDDPQWAIYWFGDKDIIHTSGPSGPRP